MLQNICNADDAELVVNTLGNGRDNTSNIIISFGADTKEPLPSLLPSSLLIVNIASSIKNLQLNKTPIFQSSEFPAKLWKIRGHLTFALISIEKRAWTRLEFANFA